MLGACSLHPEPCGISGAPLHSQPNNISSVDDKTWPILPDSDSLLDVLASKQPCLHSNLRKCRSRSFADLQAHMLTHQYNRPEKCPIATSKFEIKGFARKYDVGRFNTSVGGQNSPVNTRQPRQVLSPVASDSHARYEKMVYAAQNLGMEHNAAKNGLKSASATATGNFRGQGPSSSEGSQRQAPLASWFYFALIMVCYRCSNAMAQMEPA